MAEQSKSELPTLYKIVQTACVKPSLDRKHKTEESVVPAVVSVIAKCLGIYSDKMSAHRNLVALLLHIGGIKDQYMERLAKLYDTVLPRTILPKLNDFAGRYDLLLKQWVKDGSMFCIVFDNVDIYTKPRHQAAEKTNIMHNMVQAIAVKDRIDTTILPQTPLCHADDLQHEHLLPDLEDEHNVKSLMVKEVMEVWRCYSDDLSWIEPAKFTHRYSRKLRNKSEFVSILYLLNN